MNAYSRTHRFAIEELDTRQMLTGLLGATCECPMEEPPIPVSPQTNAFIPTDVNDDGHISPLDALLVINELNGLDSGIANTTSDQMKDVDGDGLISPRDALQVVNELSQPGRDTAVSLGSQFLSANSTDWVFSAAFGSGHPIMTYHEDGTFMLIYCTPPSEIPILGHRGVLVNTITEAVSWVSRD